MEILTGTDGAEEAHWNNGCLIGRGAKMRRDNFTPPLFAASILYQMRIRSLLLFFSILLMSGAVQGQRFYVKLSGKVTAHFTGDPVKGVLVRLLKAGKQEAEKITRADGSYEFTLDRGWRYSVWFSRKGMVTKHINIDTEEVPAYPDVPFYEMDVQMTMVDWISEFDFSVFEQPLGEASFKQSVRNMSWDIDYTERMRPMLAKVMDEYEKTYRGYYKRKRPKKSATGAAAKDSTAVEGNEELEEKEQK